MTRQRDSENMAARLLRYPVSAETRRICLNILSKRLHVIDRMMAASELERRIEERL